jgi:hypothetical protein
MTRWVLIAAFLLLATGCLYPGNLTKAQWNALPRSEQERLLKEEQKQVRQNSQIGAMPRAASSPLTSQPRR